MKSLPNKRDRSKTLGGSDMGVLLGVSSYNTPVELWMEKTGKKSPKERKNDLPAEMGHELEPVILRRYEKFHNVVLNSFIDDEGNKKVHKTSVPYIVVEYDALDEFNETVVDAKNKALSAFLSGFGDPELEEIPRDIMCQMQTYIWASGYDQGCLAVLYDSFHYIEYHVKKNQNLIDEILEAADRFWECVQKDIPPKPKTYREALMLWKPEVQVFRAATSQERDMCKEYHRLTYEAELIVERQEEIKAALMKRVLEEKCCGLTYEESRIFSANINKKGIRSGRVLGKRDGWE